MPARCPLEPQINMSAWGFIMSWCADFEFRVTYRMGFIEAGSLPKVALTSYKALVWYAGAPSWSRRPHDPVVLVLGGSGGCGTVGIQLARHFGAGVIWTTTTAANKPYVIGLGATHSIDYQSESWLEVVGNRSIDVIYDTVGIPRQHTSLGFEFARVLT